MAKKGGGMSSTMNNPHGTTVSDKGKTGDTMDRNAAPAFADPHSKGKDTIPEVFSTGVNGKSYVGRVDDVAKNVISSTMQGNKPYKPGGYKP